MSFIKSSENERLHIKESSLLNTLNLEISKLGYFYLSHFITDVMGKDNYDMSICYTNSENKYLRVYIEVKVRYNRYEDYFLQKDKVDSIKRTAEFIGGDYMILYVNFCLDGTYMWKIKDISKYKLEKRMCKQYSSIQSEYVNKKVYLLPTSEAKFIDYIHNSSDDDYYINSIGSELGKDIEL